MNRRRFMSMALKAAGFVAIAPVLPHLPKPDPKDKVVKKFEAVTEGCCPEHTKPDKIPGYPDCANFTPQITIHDYKVGETIPYQDLADDLPLSCSACLYAQEHTPGRCDIVIDPKTFKHKRRHFRRYV